MSFEIKKIYTDNPYVDEMVYYTRLMSMDTVLKMQDLADKGETVESLKRAGIYISCVEGTAIFEIFPYVTREALNNAGIVNPITVEQCLQNKNKVPLNKRKEVTKAMITDYIKNYEELNPYYRMLHGEPPIGQEDYVTDWEPPEGVEIDLSKPIHKMNNLEVSILDRYGILDDLIEKDPINNQYMRRLGKKKIDYYFSRRANRFDILYLPTIDSDAIEKMYRDKLDANKFYVLRTVYSEAFKYNSDYYDNFIAVLIILITVIDIISRVQEFIARKEIFDIRSVQYIFKSYGVPFFENIPLKYQIAMVKNLHTLLKYKSTAKCMVDICSLFGFKNIKIFKYYLLRDRRIDLSTGEYVYKEDEEGNEDLDAEYELKFIKLPLDEDLDDYVRIGGNYVDYDEITEGDAKWDGGLDHDMVMKEILKQEFNFTRTKYISIDTIYEIAKMSAQQSYFFNFLYDNVDLESMLTIQVPYIEAGREFNVADLFTLLTVLTYYYRKVKDTIMDTHSKVLYVNGFNFKADLSVLAAEIGAKHVSDLYDIYEDPNSDGDNNPYTGDPENIILDPGSTLHAQEQLRKFQKPTSSIPSFNEMMDIYVNNMEVRDELIKGMQEADNKRVYDVYKKLYDALMTVEFTMDYYERKDAPLDPPSDSILKDELGEPIVFDSVKNLPKGEDYKDKYAKVGKYWYKYVKNDNNIYEWTSAVELYYYVDEEGDATYSEFLKHKDYSLYNVVLDVQEFEDDESRNQYISNLIDSIVYALEQYIDTDEFQSLFSNLPVMSTESVKQYIATVINFYKSYKVDFLGLNTIYILDDKNDGYIRLIDDLMMKRFFQKNEFVKIYDKFAKNIATATYDERVKLIERLYFDIRTWLINYKYEHINVRDELYEKLTKLVVYSVVQLTEEICGISLKQTLHDSIITFDCIDTTINSLIKEDLGVIDKAWVYDEEELADSSPWMSKVEETDEDRIITASKYGDSKASVYISNSIPDETTLNLVTEKAVDDYVKDTTVSKENIVDFDADNASEEEIPNEKSVFEALSFNTIDEE